MPKINRKFAGLWGLWAIAFLLIESVALYSGTEGGTLSELIWAWLEGGWARNLLLGGFFGWLIIHFFGRGKAG